MKRRDWHGMWGRLEQFLKGREREQVHKSEPASARCVLHHRQVLKENSVSKRIFNLKLFPLGQDGFAF